LQQLWTKCRAKKTVDSYFGAVLPALHAIKRISSTRVPKHTEALVSSLLAGLHQRFGDSMISIATPERRRCCLLQSRIHTSSSGG